MTGGKLYRLMTWLSPAYPVGSFSYSGGLESAVADGQVTDRASLFDWIATSLRHGAGWIDAWLFAVAHGAAASGDQALLHETAELGYAMTPSAETRLQTTSQGEAFLIATRDAWPCPELDLLDGAEDPVAIVFPVAVAMACAGHGVPVRAGVAAYLTEFAANLVSAGMRLVPLGQRDGQRAIAALEPVVTETTDQAIASAAEPAGSCATVIDIASMRHETLYTRLFRS
jgi:urease accessory protein